jgi:hypothetical protein
MKTLFIQHYKKHDPTNYDKVSGKEYPFVIIEIRNKKAILLKDYDDGRVPHIFSLIKKTLEHTKERRIPDTKLYFWVSDRVPWELGNNMDKYPFFVFASPKNVNSVIFPDNLFECLTMKEKFKGECWDWDRVRELFRRNSDMKKKDIIYFKGTPTTAKIHKLRETLANYARSRNNMIIKLDGWTNYEPIDAINQYNFLLNLPGHYPWSNRFKYLFLTNSVIININVFTKAINEEGWNEEEYHSFIDLIMKPNIDYIDIKFTYYNAGISRSADAQDKARRLNEAEINKVIDRINYIYEDFRKNPEQYQKMIASYRAKISKLDNGAIYNYIYKCICLNSGVIKN